MTLESEIVALYREHAADLMRWAVALSRDTDLARDAVQEAFLRYFIERRYGRSIEKPRSWLYVVMRHYLASHGAVKAAVAAGVEPDSLATERGNPEQLAQSAELARRMLMALTPRESACLRLRAEGHRHAEIAEMLSVRPGTVGALLSRVATKLRPLIEQPRSVVSS